MSPYSKLIVAAVAVSAFTAACSSSGSGGTPPSATTLKGVVVQQGDLPSGWTGKPAAADSAGDKSATEQLAACVGAKGSANEGQLKDVKSDDFSMGQNDSVSSDATSYKTSGDVRHQVDLLKNPKTGGCLNSILKKSIAAELPSSATIAKQSLHLDTSGDQVSSNVVGTVSGSVTVSVSGKTATVYLTEAFITGRELTSTVSFTSLGTQLPASMIKSVTKAVAKRAASV